MHHTPFFIFGAGQRRKLVYRRGQVRDALTGELLHAFDVTQEVIDPGEARVALVTRRGETITLSEDAGGVWLERDGLGRRLTSGPVVLPDFAGHPHAPRLKALHHEILVNIVYGRPLPSLLVYPLPWYRDAAMMAMALARTGNLELIRDWVMGLDRPFDRNNGGECEPDNLGQALYLISLAADARHPLTATILERCQAMTENGALHGLTDGSPHPVYQTQWLKFGLSALGLPDPYSLPVMEDTYANLCWWSGEAPPGGLQDGKPKTYFQTCTDYPYLAWAEAHFLRLPPPITEGVTPRLLGEGYPLTWEINASQADYSGMARIAPEMKSRRWAGPHAWHAAEAFLYLLDEQRPAAQPAG